VCVLRLLLLPAERNGNERVVWTSGSADPSITYGYGSVDFNLVCQNDGNVVLYDDSETAIWSTNTSAIDE
jgi:hypothetical protein